MCRSDQTPLAESSNYKYLTGLFRHISHPHLPRPTRIRVFGYIGALLSLVIAVLEANK